MKLKHIYEVLWKDPTFYQDREDMNEEGTETISLGVVMKETSEAIFLASYMNKLKTFDYIWIPKSLIVRAFCLGKSHLG